MAEQTIEHGQPLTVLAEDELLFRDSVREFANGQVRPRVREMDEHAKIPRELVNQLFDLGVMGSEVIKRRYLPRLASATVGAYALSEAGSGSDAFALTTRAALANSADGDHY